MTTLPPAQPSYIFRGHSAQIHAVCFLRHNTRLLTGDADGWVVLWNLANKRAVAVWQPHTAAILGVGSWGDDRIITYVTFWIVPKSGTHPLKVSLQSKHADNDFLKRHGRDSHLRVWQLKPSDENSFSTTLPVEESITRRKEPWLLHSLPVNTLNFCPFASCPEQQPKCSTANPSTTRAADDDCNPSEAPPPLLIATLAPQDDTVAVWSLPSEARRHTVQPPPNLPREKVGMVMAIRLLYGPGGSLCCITGHESGTVVAQSLSPSGGRNAVYVSRPHSQPVLSLDVLPPAASGDGEIAVFSSSADAVLAMHCVSAGTLDSVAAEAEPRVAVNTKHAGQQALSVRSDGRILATAGWDGRVRVYSTKSLRELAVLKWHSLGCYALAFAKVLDREGDGEGAGAARVIEGKEAEGVQLGVVDRGDTGAISTVRQRREQRVQRTHWIAVGSKDGKVSLWDIY